MNYYEARQPPSAHSKYKRKEQIMQNRWREWAAEAGNAANIPLPMDLEHDEF